MIKIRVNSDFTYSFVFLNIITILFFSLIISFKIQYSCKFSCSFLIQDSTIHPRFQNALQPAPKFNFSKRWSNWCQVWLYDCYGKIFHLNFFRKVGLGCRLKLSVVIKKRFAFPKFSQLAIFQPLLSLVNAFWYLLSLIVAPYGKKSIESLFDLRKQSPFFELYDS